jgi:hypothetical protein
VNGIPVRDPYAGNIIPASDSLRSNVAAQNAALMVHPDRPGLSFNVAGNPSGDQTWILNARTIEFRIDHLFTQNFRMSHSFYMNHRPSIRNCGEVAGCVTQFDGATEPEKNVNYYGVGFYQRIATLHAHQQFDWIISNNLLNHTTVAFDRWFMGGNRALCSLVLALLAELSRSDGDHVRAERLDPSTVWRWMQRYAPELNERTRRELNVRRSQICLNIFRQDDSIT